MFKGCREGVAGCGRGSDSGGVDDADFVLVLFGGKKSACVWSW